MGKIKGVIGGIKIGSLSFPIPLFSEDPLLLKEKKKRL